MAVGVHHFLARKDAVGDDQILNEYVRLSRRDSWLAMFREKGAPWALARVGTKRSSTGTGARSTTDR
jgi:hypothetical protein